MRYPLLVDAAGAQAAAGELERAQTIARRYMLAKGADSNEYKRASRKVQAAQSKLDDCYEMLLLQALPPDELEALAAAHPPTAEQMEAARRERDDAQRRGEEPPPWPVVNDATYYPELLARCAVEAGMSADDWSRFLAENVSDGERRALCLAVSAINARERAAEAAVLPKGWIATSS